MEPDLRQGRLSSYILTERTGYAFNASPQTRLDTDDVTSFYRQGQEVRKQELWAEAIDCYGRALSCFRGDFLADEPDTDWIVPLREHWKKVRHDILVAKAESHLFLNFSENALKR